MRDEVINYIRKLNSTIFKFKKEEQISKKKLDLKKRMQRELITTNIIFSIDNFF